MTTTLNGSTPGGNGQLNDNTFATDWTNVTVGGVLGYNFVFTPGTADTTGADGVDGQIYFWGPDDCPYSGTGKDTCSSNGFNNESPLGGNFIAADGAFDVEPIEQSVSGLIIGQEYAVSFWWAGAQQAGYTGATQDQWTVSLGSEQESTALVANTSEGFTGWMFQTFDFTATATTETLSFLAYGTPNGVPPFSLLADVTMSPVPEPATMALIGVGLIAIPIALKRRRNLR